MTFALMLVWSASVSAVPELEPAAVTSLWLAKVSRQADHNAQVDGNAGTQSMETFAFVMDAWFNDRFAVGGAYTAAYGSKAPFILLLEARLSARQRLTDQIALVAVVSAGFPQTGEGYKAAAPSLGFDTGVAIHLREHVALRADLGVVRVAFTKREQEIVFDQTDDTAIADVKRTLAIEAIRITVGVVVDL